MEMILNYVHSGFSAVGPFVILLGLLIFVHELGHFLVARWCGVRVETFSLGFGKKIFKYKKGDTTYCISLVPLGGYVKMFGDEIGADISEEDKKYSFTHKPVWARIAVVLAGPLMNFFFAILVFMVVSIVGEDFRAPQAGDILKSSPAYEAGYRSGDLVLTVDDKKVRTWDELQHALSLSNGKQVKTVVQRDGSEQTVAIDVIPKLSPNNNVLSLDNYVGDIDGFSSTSRAPVLGIKAGLAAEKAGFKSGDLIKTVNGKQVKYFRELENLLLAYQGQSFSVEVERTPELDPKRSQSLKIEMPATSFSSLEILGIEEPDLYLAKVMEKTPAATAGLMAGDKIIEVAGKVPSRWEDVLNTIKNYNGSGAIALKIERGAERKSIDVTPQLNTHMTNQGGEEKRFTIGIIPNVFPAPSVMTTVKADGLGSALSRGVERSVQITIMTAVSFLRLAQGIISPKNIGGIISIGQAASETFKIGISHFLSMMGIISINLFILNLLPIPILDGGHLLFYVIEALRGAPISMRKMEIAQQVGLFVLMGLMVFALFNDFSRVFGAW